MTDAPARHFDAARRWFAQAAAEGFLDGAQAAALDAVERHASADLFPRGQFRPLVVAFFGGTGVGKSSLLNRLAGREIARTGVERPTSRELTLYVHRGVALADLPPELPLGEVRVERHDNDDQRSVLWVDAPDADSTLASNRRAVMAWLPLVDLVVYVVSPERYRDDVGWRVLLKRRARHGWVFVLNRWDEGSLEQRADFERILRGAGFDPPALFATCCAAPAIRRGLPSPDEFEQVEAAVRAVSDEHGRRELARLGHHARLHELRNVLVAAADSVGNVVRWRAARDAWEAQWAAVREALIAGLDWPMRSAAGRLAARERGSAWTLVRGGLALLRDAPSRHADPDRRPSAGHPDPVRDDAPPPSELTYLTRDLWDEWARGKLASAVEVAENELYAAGLPPAAVRETIQCAVRAAPDTLVREMQDRLRAALAQPGTELQRNARRVTGFLMVASPFAAGAWIAVHVVNGFRLAAAARAPFLGLDFAMHSAMLMLVSWAVPFAVDRMLRPSLESTIVRAGRQAIVLGLDSLLREVRRCFDSAAQRAEELQRSAASIAADLQLSVQQPPDRSAPALRRVMASATQPG